MYGKGATPNLGVLAARLPGELKPGTGHAHDKRLPTARYSPAGQHAQLLPERPGLETGGANSLRQPTAMCFPTPLAS